MSALGHKQTCAAQKGMSALPPKADISRGVQHVRSVPMADIAHSLDYLVGAREQCRRLRARRHQRFRKRHIGNFNRNGHFAIRYPVPISTRSISAASRSPADVGYSSNAAGATELAREPRGILKYRPTSQRTAPRHPGRAVRRCRCRIARVVGFQVRGFA